MDFRKALGICISLCVLPLLGLGCVFDSIIDKQVNLPKVSIKYGSHRSKRDADNFTPLRFHLHIQEPREKFAVEIRRVLEKATSKVSQLLHVIPVQGPILLERTSCTSAWSQGPNKGRCSSFRARPQEEFCENKIDAFQIPEAHLQKLDVYNFNSTDPVVTLPAGDGINNADYVLYVKSRFTKLCEQEDVQAYASYCRLDQYSRPIAGFINFCPSPSRKKAFDVHYFLNIAVHEIFHALGFSRDLFPLYSGCPTGSSDCDKKNFLITDSYGVTRLTFPSVSSEMAIHFNCSNGDFGAPLEKVNGSVTSHWDPLLLHCSIMTPSMDDPEFVLIDALTLSVFADSGWYLVDYELSDDYFWGKGEGCSFGFEAGCRSKGNILCDPNDSIPGCDMMHYTETECVKVSPSNPCGVYKPDHVNDCRKIVLEIHGTHLHHLRCFVLESYRKIHTICAAYDCSVPDSVAVLVGSSWVQCPSNKMVKVHETTLLCPDAEIICSGKDDVEKDKITMRVGSTACRLMCRCGLTLLLFLWLFS